MRISKRFKLSLTAALVGLAIHSGLVAAEPPVGPTARGGRIGTTLRNAEKRDALPEVVVRLLVNSCRDHFPGDTPDTAECVWTAFLNVCPISPAGRHFKECKDISTRLRLLGYTKVPAYTCATKENVDQLCLILPTTVSSGDLLPISIDIGDLDGGAVDNVVVTLQVSSASGAELSQPYRDPENPGDFHMTWTGGPYDWVGTASLGSISGTVSAQPVFAIGNVPAGDSVTVTGHADYEFEGQSDSIEIGSQVGLVVEEAAFTAE